MRILILGLGLMGPTRASLNGDLKPFSRAEIELDLYAFYSEKGHKNGLFYKFDMAPWPRLTPSFTP